MADRRPNSSEGGTVMRPLEVADVVCKTAGDTESEMADHALECPPYLLPNTMIGVLGQERPQVPQGYWSRGQRAHSYP
jgi:hypothetical protein